LIYGNKLYSANCGDSRAILVEDDKGSLSIRQLSIDHKPELEVEYK